MQQHRTAKKTKTMRQQNYNPAPDFSTRKAEFLSALKSALAECDKPQDVRNVYSEIKNTLNGEVFALVPETFSLLTAKMREVKRGTSCDLQDGENDFDAAPLLLDWQSVETATT